MGSSSGAAAPMAGGRGCQEQEKQQDGTKGAWDGAAANGGEAERGEGGDARESLLQRKRKEGATAAAPLRRTALTAEISGRRSFADMLQCVWISTPTGSAYDLVLDSCGAAMRAGAALAVAATAAFHRCLGVLIKGV